jgi:hypothetical protein
MASQIKARMKTQPTTGGAGGNAGLVRVVYHSIHKKSSQTKVVAKYDNNVVFGFEWLWIV